MTWFRKSLTVIAVCLVGAGLLGRPGSAQAAFQLSWDQSTAFLGNDPTNSIFVFNASGGGFTVAGSATGNSLGGSPSMAFMDLNLTTIMASAAGDVTLVLTQNGLTTPL